MSVACEAVDEIFVRINLHDGKISSELFQRDYLCLKARLRTKDKITLHNHTTLCRDFLFANRDIFQE